MTDKDFERLFEADKNLTVDREMINSLDCRTAAQKSKKEELLKTYDQNGGRGTLTIRAYRNLRDDIKGILKERMKWESGAQREKVFKEIFEEFKKSEAWDSFARDLKRK